MLWRTPFLIKYLIRRSKVYTYIQIKIKITLNKSVEFRAFKDPQILSLGTKTLRSHIKCYNNETTEQHFSCVDLVSENLLKKPNQIL